VLIKNDAVNAQPSDLAMKKSKCPACKKVVELEKGFTLYDLIKCPHCKTVLEVVRIEPAVLDWVDQLAEPSPDRRNDI